MTRHSTLLLVIVLSVYACQWCTAQSKVEPEISRLALVIGNQDYVHAPLINARNDADDVAATLRNLGFEVILKKDINLSEVEEAVWEFGRRLRDRGGVGLFYYSGHGFGYEGQNYLVPLGAEVRSEADVRFKLYPAERVLAEMESAENEMNIVIFDACRTNPLGESLWKRVPGGLNSMEGPAGSLIALATSPGKTASPRSSGGRNSVFTKHFLQELRRDPSQDILALFRDVNAGVVDETRGEQVPWVTNSIGSEFCFARCGEGPRSAEPIGAGSVDRRAERSARGRMAEADGWGSCSAKTRRDFEIVDGTLVRDERGRYPKTIRHRQTGLEFVYVPGGSFRLGDAESHRDPERTVWITGSYIGKTEVSWNHWTAARSAAPAGLPDWYQKGDHPIINVSWDDARAWCQRLGFDLPSEAQWEYAASGPQDREYPWGDSFDVSRCNIFECPEGNCWEKTSPVGSFPQGASWCGALDMTGNVWEWCLDASHGYESIKEGSRDPVRMSGDVGRNGRMIRGGSWRDPQKCSSATYRCREEPSCRDTAVGFRAARAP